MSFDEEYLSDHHYCAMEIHELQAKLKAAEAAATKHDGEWLVQSVLQQRLAAAEAEVVSLGELASAAARHAREVEAKLAAAEAQRDALQAAINQLHGTPVHHLRGCVNVLADKLAGYTGKTVPTEIAGAESVLQRLAAAEALEVELSHEISYYESLVDENDETDWPHRDGRFRDWLQERLKRLVIAKELLREACGSVFPMDDDETNYRILVPRQWYERAKGACGE